MLRRVLRSYNTRAHRLKPALRLLLSRPALPMFVPVALAAGQFGMAALVIFYAWLVARLSISVSTSALEATGLKSLADAVAREPRARIFTLDDYFPQELPPDLWKHPSFRGRPFYLVVYLPGAAMPFAVPFNAQVSFIAFGSPPDPARMNPYRYFVLLHELGHAGRRNREEGASRLDVWLAAAGSAATVMVFAAPTHALLLVPLVLLAGYTSLFSRADGPLEAEVRADHFAIFAADLLRHSPYFTTGGADRGPLYADGPAPGEGDLSMLERIRDVRPQNFRDMREDARAGKLEDAEFYLEHVRVAYHHTVEVLVGTGLVIVLGTATWLANDSLEWRRWVAAIIFGVLITFWVVSNIVKNSAFERIQNSLWNRDSEAAERIGAGLQRWADTQASLSSRAVKWMATRTRQQE